MRIQTILYKQVLNKICLLLIEEVSYNFRHKKYLVSFNNEIINLASPMSKQPKDTPERKIEEAKKKSQVLVTMREIDGKNATPKEKLPT